MKKIIIFIIFLIGLLMFFISNNSKQIRVRIIPNDNEEQSLVVKALVKEKVVIYLDECYSKSYEGFIENINASLLEFNELLEEYDAIASLEKHNFSNKTYNGNVIKDTSTLTFLVKIGNHQGDNWWGVVYPKFLEIESTEEVEYKSYIVEKFKEWFGD